MARSKHSRKKGESFAGIPRVVMDCPDYIGLSGNAIRLLNEMAYQYKGANNGDLSPAWTLMKVRGFSSKATLDRAVKELVAAGMIVLTRQGQFIRNVTSLYAVTWEPIHECPSKHLELEPTRNKYRDFNKERHLGWPKKTDRPVQKLYRMGTETVPKANLRAVS